MNNLSLTTTFVILGLNIIATSVEALPPWFSSTYVNELLSLTKQTQESQKASQPVYPAFSMNLPSRVTFDQGLDNGHLLIFLAVMIVVAISYIFERLEKKYKKN